MKSYHTTAQGYGATVVRKVGDKAVEILRFVPHSGSAQFIHDVPHSFSIGDDAKVRA